MSDRTTYLVFSNCVPGKEDEFNEWYDKVHVPEILATPGLISAQRFDLLEPEISRSPEAKPPTHRYLTIYEMEGDVDAAMGKIREGVANGSINMSGTLDLPSSVMNFWSPRGAKVEA